VDGSWGCKHASDTVEKSFCEYLVGDTNQEALSKYPLSHLAFYAGWPPAMTALQIARTVFDEAGV
jgi:hypothetical protein